MPKHSETRLIAHPVEKVFRIVADVERYPEFLPWAQDCKIVAMLENGFVADLSIGYGPFQETYRSEVILNVPKTIQVNYLNGPFSHLQNEWTFEPGAGGTQVSFLIDFEFKSWMLQKLMESVFLSAVQQMVQAFEDRLNTVV